MRVPTVRGAQAAVAHVSQDEIKRLRWTDGEGKIDNIIRDRNNAALKESPSERAEPVARPLDSSSQAACTAERFVRARCLAVAEESPKMSAMLKSGNGRASQLGIDLGA